MPLKQNPLLEALSDLRDRLKTHYRDAFGRMPTICTDEALFDMVKTKPMKIEDFRAIQTLNDAFIENYAHHFLAIILRHRNTTVHEVNLSKASTKILANYKDRLTNISRRNRNLHTSSLSQRLSCDLLEPHLTEELTAFMLGKKRVPLRLTHTRKEQTKEEESFYRTLTLLYREINREAKEKGTYDLFIAYPFVEGKLQGEDFDIKAPLFFYPVTLERKGYDFYLSFNKEKDVLYNRDLILANNKFSHFEDIQNIPTIEGFDIQTFNKTLLPFYKDNHIHIEGDLQSYDLFEPFESTLKKDFKRIKKGDLKLKKYIVLGKYQIHSSKLQEDLTRIISNKTYNDLLETLLESPYKTYDYDKATPFKLNHHTRFKEADLTYINDLNYAQEKVLDLINKHDHLVIWGPPGTGKSQTITSLIANQIEKGENVLVVSEKKVALDVIRSRLGSAAKHTFFLDDAQDKQGFYSQLRQQIDPLPPSRSLNNDRTTLDDQVEAVLTELKKMHTLFYTPSIQNVKLYEIYPRYVKTKDLVDTLLPETIHNLFYKTFKDVSFDFLKQLEARFESPTLLNHLLSYLDQVEQTPFLQYINPILTRSEKLKRAEFHKAFEALQEDLNKQGVFKRRKQKNLFILTYKSKLDYYFKKKTHALQFLKTMVLDPNVFNYVKDNHKRFDKLTSLLKKLSNEEMKYINLLRHHEPFTAMENIHTYHKAIFDAVYTGYIEKFEAINKPYVKELKYYKTRMEHLEKLIKQKKQMCTETFAMKLYQHALDFSNTKRIMDIKRRLDSTRKWSVSKFVDTFQLELFSNVKVWLMTPEAVSEIIPLNFSMFDLVIFDEASQMYVEKGIPTIYRAKKVVIAGDTKQLRPSSLGQGRYEYDDDLYEDDADIDISLDAQSLLDLARYKYKETILNYHYRSVYEELIGFSNHAFYEGKLIVSPNLTKPKKPPIEYMVVEDGLWENRQNKAEALKVIELIKKILRTRTEKETIGVITFNINQRNLIEDYLDEEIFTNKRYTKKIQNELNRYEAGEDRSLFIKNIENVQGDERDIIIFSTAYAKNTDGRFLRQFGWLNNEGGQNRLNVAISRAKKKIYLVTSFYPAEFHVEDLKSEGPKLLKKYMQYCHYVSNKDQAGAKRMLRLFSDQQRDKDTLPLTPLQDDVFKRLQKEKFDIETNVGIGGYTIDFAVYDEVKNQYKLGILCDVEKEDASIDIRDAFYHKQKYLEARGWTLYRVFAPNWFKDANHEMREIRKRIKDTS